MSAVLACELKGDCLARAVMGSAHGIRKNIVACTYFGYDYWKIYTDHDICKKLVNSKPIRE